MTLTLSLPPDTEAKLREQAANAGKDVAEFVREAVEEKLSTSPVDPKAKTPAQRVAEFEAWVASHKPVSHFVDDSRESIYEGRGE